MIRRQPFKPLNQRSGKPPEEFAEVGPGCGEHGVDGITRQTGQEAAVHSMIAFEVTVRWPILGSAAGGTGRLLPVSSVGTGCKKPVRRSDPRPDPSGSAGRGSALPGWDFALSGLGWMAPCAPTQGVALGWTIPPLQGTRRKENPIRAWSGSDTIFRTGRVALAACCQCLRVPRVACNPCSHGPHPRSSVHDPRRANQRHW